MINSFLLPLAQTDPSALWTSKDVLVLLIPTVVGFVSITAGIIVPFYKRKISSIQALEDRNKDLIKETNLANEEKIKAQLQSNEFQEENQTLRENINTLKAEKAQLNEEMTQSGAELAKLQSDLKEGKNKITNASKKDGQSWLEKVRSTAPEFLPLDPDARRTPIISVLNLKGGVGKTTVTANLGAALDSLGYRVLLLDLDLQGSLSSMFITDQEQAEYGEQDKLVEDFLLKTYNYACSINEYLIDVLGQSAIAAASDSLFYAETNLEMKWILREKQKDPRFLLRKALHRAKVWNNYDVILLDCAPVINVACVNALAASDYVLTPILPSKQATNRVPILLKRLRECKQNMNPDLKMLGVLLNRSTWSELTQNEKNRMNQLKGHCKDIWGQDVPQFNTFVRRSKEIREAEDEHRTVSPDGEMFPIFQELAREVESYLPQFCGPKTVDVPNEKEVAG